jgi:hypothetical protein
MGHDRTHVPRKTAFPFDYLVDPNEEMDCYYFPDLSSAGFVVMEQPFVSTHIKHVRDDYSEVRLNAFNSWYASESRR